MTDLAFESRLRQLVPAAAGGDRRAYGELVASCQNTVTGIALAIVRDVPSSQDIAQDAFLTAWQKLSRLENPDSFLPWLRQITRNLARDHLRAQRHRQPVVDDIEAVIARVADPTPCPEGLNAQREEADAALAALDALPEESREVLLLFYREGQRSQQVASLLGISDAAVRKRLSRARQALREDVLARLGRFASSSAPGVAFTIAVTAALTTASPPAAAALIAASAAASGKTLGQWLLGTLGGAAIGIAGAFLGIFWGLKRQLSEALDAEEARALTRSAWVNAFATIGFLVGILAAARWTEGWLWPVIATLIFFAVISWQAAVVQPRAMARRHAIEARQDPTAAARRRSKERRLRWLGFITGLACGGGGLIYGLSISGRLVF